MYIYETLFEHHMLALNSKIVFSPIFFCEPERFEFEYFYGEFDRIYHCFSVFKKILVHLYFLAYSYKLINENKFQMPSRHWLNRIYILNLKLCD